MRASSTIEDLGSIKSLEREVRELRQANEILRKASAYFAQAERVLGKSRTYLVGESPAPEDVARPPGSEYCTLQANLQSEA